jgi:hypothetical protein
MCKEYKITYLYVGGGCKIGTCDLIKYTTGIRHCHRYKLIVSGSTRKQGPRPGHNSWVVVRTFRPRRGKNRVFAKFHILIGPQGCIIDQPCLTGMRMFYISSVRVLLCEWQETNMVVDRMRIMVKRESKLREHV